MSLKKKIVNKTYTSQALIFLLRCPFPVVPVLVSVSSDLYRNVKQLTIEIIELPEAKNTVVVFLSQFHIFIPRLYNKHTLEVYTARGCEEVYCFLYFFIFVVLLLNFTVQATVY